MRAPGGSRAESSCRERRKGSEALAEAASAKAGWQSRTNTRLICIHRQGPLGQQ